jgi:hypothetical protein
VFQSQSAAATAVVHLLWANCNSKDTRIHMKQPSKVEKGERNMRVLVQFVLRHFDFRMPELDSLLEMHGLQPNRTYNRCAQ